MPEPPGFLRSSDASTWVDCCLLTAYLFFYLGSLLPRVRWLPPLRTPLGIPLTLPRYPLRVPYARTVADVYRFARNGAVSRYRHHIPPDLFCMTPTVSRYCLIRFWRPTCGCSYWVLYAERLLFWHAVSTTTSPVLLSLPWCVVDPCSLRFRDGTMRAALRFTTTYSPLYCTAVALLPGTAVVPF